jgi:CheY-like chemotaxis protein/Tfp pilus assembly protein PilZ
VDSGRTLLVVDDVPMFRELGALFLARSGKVLTAEDGAEALEIARRERPVLVLSDLQMPRMDGAALCAEIKSDPEIGRTPVIVMTGSELAADHARAVLAGADDVIPKPMSRGALLETVNRFLRFPSPRGLPRAAVDAAVRIRAGAAETWGKARNLSRSGIFVEADLELSPQSDVALDFELPEAARHFSTTARVIWRRPEGVSGGHAGLGLRFVGIDGKSTRAIAEYVHERTSPLRAAFVGNG